MNEDDFRKLVISLMESFDIDPAVAQILLARIIKFLKENNGGKRET